MNDQTIAQHLEEVKKVLESAKNVFVLLPQNPSFDATASGLALYLSLKEQGKNVVVGSSSEMKVEFSKLVGINRISDKIGNRNLVISFDYAEDSIEKVSYNLEGNKFNLVIQPKSGFPPLDTKSVNYSYEGINADLIITIGAQKLENLGKFYEIERETLNTSTIINLDQSSSNTKFGQINLVEPKSSSISEITLHLIKSLSLPMNIDIAGNLLQGMQAQTQNFQSPFASAQTFEAAAELMRAGAKRSPTIPQATRQWAPTRTASPSRMTRPTTFPIPQSRQSQQLPRSQFIPAPQQQDPIPLSEPKLDVSDLASQSYPLQSPNTESSAAIDTKVSQTITPPPAQMESANEQLNDQISTQKIKKNRKRNQSQKPGRRI